VIAYGFKTMVIGENVDILKDLCVKKAALDMNRQFKLNVKKIK
jgi:hypothetical protein